MSELRSALEDLAGIDLDGLTDDALLDLVGELSTTANRVAAALTSAARAAERREAYRRDGAVSMKSWLRGSCRMAAAEATSVVSTGRRLDALPAVAEAFADGAISATHARVITRAMTPGRTAEAADAGIELAETDRILAEHVVHWAHGGPTSCDNGALLRERHHSSCHEGGFTIRGDPGTGRWHTYLPDGTEVLSRAGP